MPKPPSKKTYRDFKPRPRVLSQVNVSYVDYKDVNFLRLFMSERSKIRPRKMTGNSIQEQRVIARAIKNAREMALVPFQSTVTSQKMSRSYGTYRDDYEEEREAEAYAHLTQQALQEAGDKQKPVPPVTATPVVEGKPAAAEEKTLET